MKEGKGGEGGNRMEGGKGRRREWEEKEGKGGEGKEREGKEERDKGAIFRIMN